MSSSLPSAATTELTLTIGAVVTGILLSEVLYGVLTNQTLAYFQAFPNDRRRIKYIVILLWTLDTVHAILLGCSLITLSMANINEPNVLFKLPITINVGFGLSLVIDLLAQAFFTHRLWVLSKNKWLTYSCCFLALFKAGSGFWGYAKALASSTLFSAVQNDGWLGDVSLGAATACDLLISISLLYILYSKKEEVLSRTTAAILEKLIAWTVRTGMAMCIVTASANICLIVMKHNFIWVALQILGSRVYSNSVLACLNGRTQLRNIDLTTVISDQAPAGGCGRCNLRVDTHQRSLRFTPVLAPGDSFSPSELEEASPREGDEKDCGVESKDITMQV